MSLINNHYFLNCSSSKCCHVSNAEEETSGQKPYLSSEIISRISEFLNPANAKRFLHTLGTIEAMEKRLSAEPTVAGGDPHLINQCIMARRSQLSEDPQLTNHAIVRYSDLNGMLAEDILVFFNENEANQEHIARIDNLIINRKCFPDRNFSCTNNPYKRDESIGLFPATITKIQTVIVNKFNNMNASTLSSLYKYSAYYGTYTIIDAISSSEDNLFPQISPDALNIAFIAAAVNGHLDCMLKIINSSRWNEISATYIEQALISAHTNGQIECVQKLINYNHLQTLTDMLYGAAVENDPVLIQILINSTRWNEIPTNIVITHFINAAHYGHKECVEMLIKSMSPQILGDTLMKAVILQLSDSLEMLIDSSRWNEIPTSALENAFSFAASKPNPFCIQTLINSNRFVEISREALNIAFTSASSSGSVDCMQALIDSPRFSEISLEVLRSAWRSARIAFPHTSMAHAIRNSNRFHDIPYLEQLPSLNEMCVVM